MSKTIILLIAIVFTNQAFSQVNQYKKLTDEALELLKQRDLDAAIVKYQQALRLKANGVEAHYGLAVSYSATCIQNGNYCKEAINHFLTVEKIAKGYRNTFRNLSSCFLKIHEYDKAILYSTKAIAQDNKDGESFFYRGFAKFELKKPKKEACADLQQALKLGFSEASTLLERYCN